MSNRRRLIRAVLLFLAGLQWQAASAATPRFADPTGDAGPFRPQLLENNDSLCPGILAEVRRQYLAPDDLSSRMLAAPGLVMIGAPYVEGPPSADPNFMADKSDATKFAVVLGPDSKVYLRFVSLGGCGGACESSMVAVSESADFDGYDDGQAGKGPAVMRTPGAAEWIAYRGSAGRYYVIAVTGYSIEVFQVAKPKTQWRAACRISIAPDELSLGTSETAKVPMQSLLAMNDLADEVAGGSSNCGTMQTAPRWAGARKYALLQGLYRPWALHSGDYQSAEERRSGISKLESENSFRYYSRIEYQLQEWSVGGLYQHRIFQRYQAQHASTVRVLADYYRKVFGWNPQRAASSAKEAVDNALAQGFGFYDYTPYPSAGEQELRLALLEHRPLGEIQGMRFDAALLDRGPATQASMPRDSVLNVAIEYPEALKWLISRGLNPGLANEFGKTPLMYAAQDNQLAAVSILLDAGADVNAATFQPGDTCNFTLQTTAVTALHYAVRNASADVIKLLLRHGAITFARTTGAGETPLDWLNQYAPGSSGQEINPNISASQLPELRQLLQPVSAKQLSGTARDLALQTEVLYAASKVQEAGRIIQSARRRFMAGYLTASD